MTSVWVATKRYGSEDGEKRTRCTRPFSLLMGICEVPLLSWWMYTIDADAELAFTQK